MTPPNPRLCVSLRHIWALAVIKPTVPCLVTITTMLSCKSLLPRRGFLSSGERRASQQTAARPGIPQLCSLGGSPLCGKIIGGDLGCSLIYVQMRRDSACGFQFALPITQDFLSAPPGETDRF